jgi:bacteriocin-like protein
MARIQITDLNPSDFGNPEELTDEELMAIYGGGWFTTFLRELADFIDDVFGE